MRELDTATIVHREKRGAAVHDFRGARIRHHSSRRVDHIASGLNEYKRRIWNVGSQATASDGHEWDNSTLLVNRAFTEVVHEIRIIKKAANRGWNDPKHRIERVRWFS